ncbi:hypothetical protein J32TS6_11330 [Virgibacillus pantothenticus]|nr:hypothetical protein J32TS6_11330 [Virgibacillus pantothenticus]
MLQSLLVNAQPIQISYVLLWTDANKIFASENSHFTYIGSHFIIFRFFYLKKVKLGHIPEFSARLN